MTTTQKVSAVLRKAGLSRSEWEASGMVRGWGSASKGYEIEVEGDTEFTCKSCSSRNHSPHGPNCFFIKNSRSPQWFTHKVPTGRIFVRWNEGGYGRVSEPGMVERMATSLREAGLSITIDDDRIVVS